MAKLFTFFFLLFLGVAIVSAHINVTPNVQFSFGCDPSIPLPQNCSGNYYFQTTLLNNESYSFFDIKLYSNYSLWDNRGICRTTPFFQYVNTYPDIFNWECCISNWVANVSICSIYDNQTKTYYDTNNCFFPNNIPLDNGTTLSCNYCSEDVIPIYGFCTDNSSQTINYFDLNQTTCCDVTGISSDCSILTYPYNDTTYQGCNSTNVNMGEPNCRQVPQIGNHIKEDCFIEIPAQYWNEPYKCYSMVIDKDTDEIVQVNPDLNRTNPVFEKREYFNTQNNIIDFYYTGENLDPQHEYVVRLECSSPERYLYSEYTIERKYEDVSWIYYRTLWATDNAPYIIGGVLILLLIGSLYFLIRKILS